MRRLWQKSMIALARNDALTGFVQSRRATSSLARRYVAGQSVADAVSQAQSLHDRDGVRASLFYLGEYVTDPAVIEETVGRKIAVGRALASAGLDVHVSVDSTQIGQMINAATARANATRIAEGLFEALQGSANADRLNALMFDMEDASVVDDTIALHDGLFDQGFAVALTLQAYLRRTEDDLRRQIERGAKVRLVKGAFVAGDDIAFAGRSAIKANSRHLIDVMFSPQAQAQGFYPIIATHDDRLQDYAIAVAQKNGWSSAQFEFEMLCGVRTELAKRRRAEGWRVRLYIPFGRDWWPYAVRRIGENPSNAWLLARSLIS